MKITYYLASSIDGCIANGEGDISWLDDLNIALEDTGYDEFYSTVEGLVMGRKTYEMILSFGTWPYGNKPVWVCASNKMESMDGCNLQEGTTPEEVVKLAKKMHINHLWLVGGGTLASSFLQRKLLTDINISLMPIILGGGIKLFAELANTVLLKEESSRFYDSGFRQLEYSIKYK